MAPVKVLVEQRMRHNDETTAVQLHALLLHHGHTMTLKAVLRCRAALGWTFRGSVNHSSLFYSAKNCFVIVFGEKRYDNVILSHTVCEAENSAFTTTAWGRALSGSPAA